MNNCIISKLKELNRGTISKLYLFKKYILTEYNYYVKVDKNNNLTAIDDNGTGVLNLRSITII